MSEFLIRFNKSRGEPGREELWSMLGVYSKEIKSIFLNTSELTYQVTQYVQMKTGTLGVRAR